MDFMRSLAVVIGISLLMMIGLYIFPVIIFLFPLAFIVIGVKYNITNSFIGILITSFLIGISVDIISGVMILAIFGPMALYIADSIGKRKKSIEIIVPSTIIFFLSTILVFIMLKDYSAVSLVEQLEENIMMYTEMQMDIIGDMELTNIESFRIRSLADDMYNYIISILPSILIVLSVFISYINYYFSIIILRRLGLAIRENPRFSKFSLPNNFIMGSLVMFLIVYLLRNIEYIPYDMIYLNLIVLVISLLFIQGLSVLDYLLIRLRLNTIFRLIIIGLIIFTSPIITFIVIVGVVDIIFDFRKLRRRKV